MITGTHSRHLFVHEAVLETGFECAAIIMDREDLLPSTPSDISNRDKINFERHFRERYDIESTVYGKINPELLFDGIPTLRCIPESLNSEDSERFVKNFKPDLVFILGPDLIKDPLLSVLPNDCVNMHLGLSPWYRGSATLFWPFYFLQPQFAGVTFHQITREADAGRVLHQCVPDLLPEDGIHDVGAKAVVKAKSELKKLLAAYTERKKWNYKDQLSSGKLFLTRDFEPAHLRVIYDSFDNNIVEAFLNGELGNRKPKLVSFF